jgi:hypothetical protein
MKIKNYVNRKEKEAIPYGKPKSLHRCTLPVLLILYSIIAGETRRKKNCPCGRQNSFRRKKPKFFLNRCTLTVLLIL